MVVAIIFLDSSKLTWFEIIKLKSGALKVHFVRVSAIWTNPIKKKNIRHTKTSLPSLLKLHFHSSQSEAEHLSLHFLTCKFLFMFVDQTQRPNDDHPAAQNQVSFHQSLVQQCRSTIYLCVYFKHILVLSPENNPWIYPSAQFHLFSWLLSVCQVNVDFMIHLQSWKLLQCWWYNTNSDNPFKACKGHDIHQFEYQEISWHPNSETGINVTLSCMGHYNHSTLWKTVKTIWIGIFFCQYWPF